MRLVSHLRTMMTSDSNLALRALSPACSVPRAAAASHRAGAKPTTPTTRAARHAVCALLVAVLVLLPSCNSGEGGAQSASVEPVGAPLVTLVTADWHRGDHLGLAFQGVDAVTPNLDALAQDGVLFRDASTSSNVSVPALAALHTGRTARALDLRSEGQALVDDASTLAEAFAAAGWNTIAVVGSRAVHAGGLTQGFAEVSAPESFERPAGEVVQQALSRLEGSQQPTFLWLHLTDLGWPHEPSAEALAQFHDADLDPRFAKLNKGKVIRVSLPPDWADVTDLPWMRAMYRAEVSDLDSALAPLFAHPRVASHWRAYAGTHGLSLGENLIWMKADGLYPGVLRVPLMLAGPGVDSGVRSDAPVRTLDLGRTLLDLAGVDGAGSAGIGGVDLLDVHAGRTPAPLRLALENGTQSAAIDDGTLQINLTLQRHRSKHVVMKRKAHQPECYVLPHDPRAEDDLFSGEGENRKRVDAHLDRIQTLLAQLRDWLEDDPPVSLRRDIERDPGQIERRAGQGYLDPAPVELRRLWKADSCLVCQWLAG